MPVLRGTAGRTHPDTPRPTRRACGPAPTGPGTGDRSGARPPAARARHDVDGEVASTRTLACTWRGAAIQAEVKLGSGPKLIDTAIGGKQHRGDSFDLGFSRDTSKQRFRAVVSFAA